MNSKKSFIIGITGVSGSGKTAISKILAKKIKATIIHLDDYWKYHNVEMRPRKEWKKWEHPSSIDFNRLYKEIVKLKRLNKNKIIIVEGFHVLHNKKIRDILDLKIYISLSDNLVIKRRLEKFGPEENQKMYSKNIVIKSYKRYGKLTKKYADLVIRGNKDINENIKNILRYVKNKL